MGRVFSLQGLQSGKSSDTYPRGQTFLLVSKGLSREKMTTGFFFVYRRSQSSFVESLPTPCGRTKTEPSTRTDEAMSACKGISLKRTLARTAPSTTRGRKITQFPASSDPLPKVTTSLSEKELSTKRTHQRTWGRTCPGARRTRRGVGSRGRGRSPAAPRRDSPPATDDMSVTQGAGRKKQTGIRLLSFFSHRRRTKQSLWGKDMFERHSRLQRAELNTVEAQRSRPNIKYEYARHGTQRRSHPNSFALTR